MPKRNNSAQRMHVILKEASAQDDRKSIGEVWAHAFGLSEGTSTQKDLEIVENLALLHNQFETTKTLARQTDYTEDLYISAFNRIDAVLNIKNLSSQWASLKSHLAPDTLLAINWLSEVIPDEINTIDSAFIENIQEQLANLKVLLNDESVPISLKSFIEHQIKIIEKALRQHDIMGTRALRDALYQGYSNSQENHEVISDNEASQELSALSKVWELVKKAPGVVVSTNKTLNSGSEIIEKGQKAVEFFQNFQI